MAHQYLSQASAAVSYLSTDDLKELLNDDAKLEERINDVLRPLNEEKEVIITENRTLAEDNVNKEPEIIERKSRVSELSEQGKTLCENVQEKLSDLKTKKGDKTPETALALLQTAASESETKSEDIVTKLQEREIAIDEFLEQFMTARKEMHLRKLKSEKMVELIRQQQANNRNGPPTSPFARSGSMYPPSNIYPPHPPVGGGVPYPTGGSYGMPMPNQMFRHF